MCGTLRFGLPRKAFRIKPLWPRVPNQKHLTTRKDAFPGLFPDVAIGKRRSKTGQKIVGPRANALA